MRCLRVIITLAAATAALIVFTLTVQAGVVSAAQTHSRSTHNRLDQDPTFTRIQTITLVTAPPEATALTTIWENRWLDLNGSFLYYLPADFSNINVTGGSFNVVTNFTPPYTSSFNEVFTNRIALAPTVGQPLYLSYRTNSRAVRQGNQFVIVLHANSSQPSYYKTTLLFNQSAYKFIGYFADPADTLQSVITTPLTTSGGVYWGPLALSAADRIDRDIVLGDVRLPIDLAIQSASVIPSSDKRSVQVNATIVNNGSVETGGLFFIELYDRPAGAPPPNGPGDHAGGACRDPQCSSYRSSNYNYHDLPRLGQNQTKSFVFNYQFEVGGLRTLYLQVDSFEFGTNYGLILEVDDNTASYNNIRNLGSYPAVGKTYLPLIRKSQ
ncbi:MAG TPA: hypothetical protein VJG32_04005 [Anaerolineae bacterium]|nr:hypothetical protein [Anaerolineae bacterium]